MSLCQSGKVSCGACCGILNLNLDKNDIHVILKNRTQFFEDSVDFKKNWTIAEYRKKREIFEEPIPRINNEIYVCPFLGFITQTNIGCMIHPARTGDPLSQNFSFYGAGICQGYDCKNKERKEINVLQDFLINNINLDNYMYMNIVGDHILIDHIKNFFESRGYENFSFLEPLKNLVIELLLRKFMIPKNLNTTSFEFDLEPGDSLNKLVDYLKITKEEEIYKRLHII